MNRKDRRSQKKPKKSRIERTKSWTEGMPSFDYPTMIMEVSGMSKVMCELLPLIDEVLIMYREAAKEESKEFEQDVETMIETFDHFVKSGGGFGLVVRNLDNDDHAMELKVFNPEKLDYTRANVACMIVEQSPLDSQEGGVL